jgi:hypothetical protein
MLLSPFKHKIRNQTTKGKEKKRKTIRAKQQNNQGKTAKQLWHHY